MSEITQADTLVRAIDLRNDVFADEGSKPVGNQTIWWSQTGSNRRPHACKARALPAELWPRNQKTKRVLSKLAFAKATAQQPSYRRACLAEAAKREGWWAWEDLNFRPHAYQARALTN